MVDQASLETQWTPPAQGNRQSAAAGVRDGIGELLHDIVTLGELQAELLAADGRQSLQKAQAPIIMLVIGAVIGLGATPVLLMALAEGLHEGLEWSRWLSYLVSGVVGAALGGGLMYFAYSKSGEIIGVFMRSRTELAENIKWIKYALTRGRRPPR